MHGLIVVATCKTVNNYEKSHWCLINDYKL